MTKGEYNAIEHTQHGPVTQPSLVADLTALGVVPGMALLVHSSLSALGWVCGGPVAVVLALEELLGPAGTLAMPAHSNLTDPASWQHPPVPESWWVPIRQTMPAFDPDLTPTRQMGAVVECLRKQPGTQRSDHPHFSFIARGPQAAGIIADHSLEYSMGERSPLARIYDLDGWVLLLGVGHSNNTSLHLAEYRANFPARQPRQFGGPVRRDGRRVWASFPDIELNSDDFAALGADFARDTGQERAGPVGSATARLMPQRALVDYAVQWLERHRHPDGSVPNQAES